MRREKKCGVVARADFAVLLVFFEGVLRKRWFWVWCFAGVVVVDCWWERGVSPRLFGGLKSTPASWDLFFCFCTDLWKDSVLPDGPTARGAVTS
jgi:hypothetical protein